MAVLSPGDLHALEAAGLYDPASPKAAERLALIEWLVTRGADLGYILDAVRRGSTLTGVAGDMTLRSPESTLTLPEVAALAGMPADRIEFLRRAVGLPPAYPDDRQFSATDATAFAAFEQAGQLFGEAAALEFMRVVGASLSRVAEAAVSLFLVSVEGPIVASGQSEVALAEANVAVMSSFETIPPVMSALLRAHLETAIRRLRGAREGRSVNLVRMTVGFVDLVGFTGLSRKLGADELAELVSQFEGTATDVITARNGRLVKVIGDEVMFVARDTAAACDIALTLIERFAGNASVAPRGGLAAGSLLARAGDYFGPTVNLASRIAELAVPREVLATEEIVAQTRSTALRFEPAGKRLLKGFDEPVTLYALVRASS
jgi:class 3 adenylate cyclase